MAWSVIPVLAIALFAAPCVVTAGPCGYGALCGRDACDSATMAAYNAAFPKILACQEHSKPYYYQTITDEATMRQWCFGGACGDAFKDIVRFHDIQRDVCEVHYPTRKEDVISGFAYATSCIDSPLYSRFESFSPAFKDEMVARIEAARSGGTPVARTTTAPPTTSPAPTTRAPPPTTAEPTTAAPTPTTAAPTPEPTTRTVAANTSANEANSSRGRDASEPTVVAPNPTRDKPPAPVPSSSAKPTSAATSVGVMMTAVAVAMALVMVN